MLPGDALLDLLRKSAQHPLVTKAMTDLGTPEVQTDRYGEYRYWSDKGITFLFEQDRLSRLIFWKTPGFMAPLPYGISLDWTRIELHRSLGAPTKFVDELFSGYEFPDEMVRVVVFFGMERGDEIKRVSFLPLEDDIQREHAPVPPGQRQQTGVPDQNHAGCT